MTAISPTQSNIAAALRAFLLAVLPTGTDVILAQQNRTPEPAGSNFVIVTPLRIVRLATNVDGSADVKFTGSIAGTTLTAASVTGAIVAGATVFGPGVTNPTTIVSQIGGTPGGAGTYQVSASQTVGPETMSAGAKTLGQQAEVTFQLDFHSADETSGDMAQTTSTTLRDEYGTTFFASLSPPLNGVSPLYADDPRQMPFINEEQQYEWRWILECCLQANQIVGVPLEYADSAGITVVDVPATYPP